MNEWNAPLTIAFSDYVPTHPPKAGGKPLSHDGVKNVNLCNEEFGNFTEFVTTIKRRGKERERKDGPYFLRGKIKEYKRNGRVLEFATRANDNMLNTQCHLLVLDGDTPRSSAKEVHDRLVEEDVPHYIYESFSHTPEKPRWRLLVPYRYKGGKRCRQLTEGLQAWLLNLGLEPGELTPESSKLSNAWYLPMQPKNSEIRLEGFEHFSGDVPDFQAYSRKQALCKKEGSGNVARLNPGDEDEAGFNPLSAINRIASGTEYHNSIIPLATHLASNRPDEEYVTAILEALMEQVPESMRDMRWHDRYRDIPRCARDQVAFVEADRQQGALLELRAANASYPPLPDSTLGEAFDWVFSEFLNTVSKPIREYTFYTVRALLNTLTQSLWIMPQMEERWTNVCAIMCGPTGEGKDTNISMPIMSVAKTLKKRFMGDAVVGIINLLNDLVVPIPNVTSDTAAIKVLNQRLGNSLLWTNTECKDVLSIITADDGRNGTNNADLARVLIQIFDAVGITGKTRANKDDEYSQIYRNVDLVYATQTAVLEHYLCEHLLDRGVLPRFEFCISDTMFDDSDEANPFGAIRKFEVSDDLLDFLEYLVRTSYEELKNKEDKQRPRYVIEMPEEVETYYGEKQRAFMKEIRGKVDASGGWTENHRKIKNRLAMLAERMLCEVARIEWYHRKWKDGNDRPFSSALSSCRDFPVITNAHVDMVAPFIRHQAEIKLLHILPMVEKQHSPRSEKLSRIIKKIQRYLDDPQLVYQHTQSKTAKGLYMEIAQKHRLVPKSLVKKNEGDDAEDVIFRAARGKVLIQVQDKRRYGTSAEFLGLADFAGEYVL